jgi:heme a synthase
LKIQNEFLPAALMNLAVTTDKRAGSVPDAKRIAYWLLTVAGLVFGIVIVGGITRLTESGLSITEWRPLMGALPPLSDAQWISEFEKYKTIPEYIEINGPAGMTLAQFKFIYFWEWVHRLLGRVIGLALAIPFFWYLLRGKLPAGYTPRIFALVMLVGLQGTVGWWMVASGLETRTDVSHFRLATHLLIALTILGGLVWTALDLLNINRKPARLTLLSGAVIGILFVQLLLGAWVAGLNAGYVSNTWPLMNERVIPDGIDWSQGTLYALTHDPFLLHFLHRWWAWIAAAALIILAIGVKKAGARQQSIAIHAALGVQIILGIATVMTGMNIILAVLHQAVGAILVAATMWGAHRLGQMVTTSSQSTLHSDMQKAAAI